MSKSEVQAETAGAQGGKKKGRVVIIIGVVVALAVCGAGAWFLLGTGKKAEHAENVAANIPPVFFTLDPFVVNLAGEVQHYLQVGIDLKIADEHVKDRIKAHLPEIRNGVLLLLSSKQIDDLSVAGRQEPAARGDSRSREPAAWHPHPGAASPRPPRPRVRAAGEAHAAEVKPAAEPAAQEPAEGVLEVLLTSFVIQ